MKREPVKAVAANQPRSAAGGTRPKTSAGLAARRAALQILRRVECERAFADVLLGQHLPNFAVADRRLITQLVLGTIAWRGRLDFELSHHSSRPLERLDPTVVLALRMGLFQVRILNRIPQHAAVDTAVTLTRELTSRESGGFVNAVLRSSIRNPVRLPQRAADEPQYLATVYSHPRWLVEQLIDWFGLSAAESLMVANNEPAPNALRLNLARGTAEDLAALIARDGMAVGCGGRFPETILLRGAPVIDGDAWRGGLFQLQAEASQLVCRLLAPATQALVLDCAAAPGGKTMHLAELVGPKGKVLAFDLNAAGLVSIGSAAVRLGHRNVLFTRADSSTSVPVRPRSAGFVLLDAPCTGLGTLREHPEIRWRLSMHDIERMAVLQGRMLRRAADTVAVGGVLVYAVCSIAPQEGSEVINTFLAENTEFAIDRTSAPEFKDLVGPDGYLRTRPDIGGLSGFFAARLKRRT